MHQKLDEKGEMYYNSDISLFYRPMNSPKEAGWYSQIIAKSEPDKVFLRKHI
jgi:hypothetical protein